MHRTARLRGPAGHVWRTLLASAAALLILTSGAATPATAAVQAPAAVQIPDGVTAGVAVFDREAGTFTEQVNADTPFRSASVVKLLLTLDFLWNRGPSYSIPAADRARLEPMLRSSNDDAANYYWSTYGGSAIINRMVRELSLTDTAPPPPVTRATGATPPCRPATP